VDTYTTDLRLECVLAVAQKLLYALVLFDPFEEQLNPPAAFVQRCDGQGRKLVLLVKQTKVCWVSGSLNLIRRGCSG